MYQYISRKLGLGIAGRHEDYGISSDLAVIVNLYERLFDISKVKTNNGKDIGNLSTTQKWDYYFIKCRLWLLNRRIGLLEKLVRRFGNSSKTIPVPNNQVLFDQKTRETSFTPAFYEALCEFYDSAEREILIFTPDFSSEVFNDQVTRKLADIVSRGVVLRIIVKNSDLSRPHNSPQAIDKLKLQLQNLSSEDLDRLLFIQINTGVPERLTKFLDSCDSAFSVVDRKHFRYRMLSSYVLDTGIFVLNAVSSISSGLLINSLVYEVFIKASSMIRKYQDENHL